jgi:hypothetical protein
MNTDKMQICPHPKTPRGAGAPPILIHSIGQQARWMGDGWNPRQNVYTCLPLTAIEPLKVGPQQVAA